ncbi:DUF927 domain-containing protein [Thiocystis violacea]|uniref:DUF927 domain-containing protein n=1 Tax=Thiocystis violacea TaxID=13725 RepID=UPI001905ADD6|nr:DUF927 domain-containing protein [Thiocystis violacea]MBK1723219.1 hypothetical protein [Thiocystis violacea]
MTSPQGPGASAPAVNLDTLPPEVRAQMAFQAPAPNDQERIREALSFVPSEDRDTWLKMGMAIKSEIGASGFDIWDDWSQGSDAYNAADARDVWKSIDASGKVRIGSLFHEAKANGWRDIDRPTPPTPAELAERKRIADAKAAQEAADIARQQAETAIKAAAVWDAAYPVTDDDRNPYLDRKGVSDANTENLRQIETDTAAKILGYHPSAGGKRLNGTLLVVPLHRGGELVSLELIDGSGTKAALNGKGTKTGAYWAAQPLDAIEGTVIVGEGVSTALSIRMATGLPVVAALSVSNFAKTISAIHAGYKRLRPILAADLDKQTGEPIEAAVKASRQFRPHIPLVTPDFGADRPEGATDFNDLHQALGLEAVREQIEAQWAESANPHDEPAIPDDLDTTQDATPTRGAPKGWKLTATMVFEVKAKEDGDEYVPVCGPLWVLGRTTGAHGEWGLVLAFVDHDERERRMAIPAERLHADPGILVSDLARMGLAIRPSRQKKVVDYLADWKPDTRILSAKRLGWLEDTTGALSFVMPDRVIARDGNLEVIFQPERYSPTVRTVHASGSLDDWQRNVATPACPHPPMLFSLCCGLATAFQAFAEAGDSFIVHFWGKTSRGKTTVGQIAASPWGCAADPNDAPSLTFIRRWNLTGNGLEGLAEAHSDMPLVLDELGSSTIGDIRPLVYQVSGGQGKTAMTSAREMKEPRSWRTIVISTGELSLHARMSDPDGDGTRSRTVKGGLTHRALDIEIDDIAGASPESDRESVVSGIKIACARSYGTAGPELVRLIAKRFNSAADARAYVREQIAKILTEIAPAGVATETLRAIKRFALVSVAGEFAAQVGLIPATTEQIRSATKGIVTAWLGASAETDEDRIVSSVRAFILRHESRFQPINEPDPPPRTDRYGAEYQPTPRAPEPVRDRVGYVDRTAGRWMFTPAGLIEAAPGNDKTTIARTLKNSGYLYTNEKEKLMARTSVGGGRPWLYVVKQSILDGSPDEKSGKLIKTPGQAGQPGRDQQPQGFEPVPVVTGTPGQPGQESGTAQVTAASVPAVPVGKHNRDSPRALQPQGFVPAVPAVPAKNRDTEKNPEIAMPDWEAF